MAKRRGKLLSELSLIQRPRLGKRGLEILRAIKPVSPVTVHRRGLLTDDYRAPDEREQYAVPDSEVHGTLPERILYKALQDRHMIPEMFSFQSSLVGGRIYLGGMVADFLCERPPVVIRVQGEHWHGQFDRETGDLIHGDIVQARRDDEQGAILNDLGYAVFDLWEETTYNPFTLHAWLAKWVDPLLTGSVLL